MEEWDPKQGGSRQAYEVKTFVCPGCNLIEGEESYRSKLKAPLHGTKIQLSPTSLHPYKGHLATSRTHKR